MRKFLLCIVLLSTLPLPAQSAGSQAGEEALLAIDAGRLTAMLDQVAMLLKANGSDVAGDDDIDSELRSTAARYRALLDLACHRDLFAGSQCAESYALPASSMPVSDSALRREIDDLTSRVHPLWIAVCTKLDDTAHAVCQME